MKRKYRSIVNYALIGTAALAAVAGGWWAALRFSESPPAGVATPAQNKAFSEKRAVYLYFGDESGHHLVAEERVMEETADPVALGKRLVLELIRGPSRKSGRTIPAEAGIRAFFVNKEGTAYLDFEDDAFRQHPGGVGAETLSIYSIVNTLVLNVDAIRAVKFLVGGKEADTLVGHIALREPFDVDMLWVR